MKRIINSQVYDFNEDIMKYLNYAKTCRKKTGLSQSEVAYLMGMKSPHFICRTELGNEISILSRAISYHILFDKQVDKIFPNLSKALALQIFKRIAKLSKQLQTKGETDATRRKLECLDHIATRIATNYKEV